MNTTSIFEFFIAVCIIAMILQNFGVQYALITVTGFFISRRLCRWWKGDLS